MLCGGVENREAPEVRHERRSERFDAPKLFAEGLEGVNSTWRQRHLRCWPLFRHDVRFATFCCDRALSRQEDIPVKRPSGYWPYEKHSISKDSGRITATFTGPRQTSFFPKAARPAAPCATYCYPPKLGFGPTLGFRWRGSRYRCRSSDSIEVSKVESSRKSTNINDER